MKFDMGNICVSYGVRSLMDKHDDFKIFVAQSIARYSMGDWGNLCEEDRKLNDEALKYGDRILAAYKYPGKSDWKIWIITESDRRLTTILFLDEY